MIKMIATLTTAALLAPLSNADLASAVTNAEFVLGASANEQPLTIQKPRPLQATIEPASLQTQPEVILLEAETEVEDNPLTIKRNAYATEIADHTKLRSKFEGLLVGQLNTSTIDVERELKSLKARLELASDTDDATEPAATMVVTKPVEVELKPEPMSATETLPAESAKTVAKADEELSFSDRAAALIQRLKQAPEKTQQQ